MDCDVTTIDVRVNITRGYVPICQDKLLSLFFGDDESRADRLHPDATQVVVRFEWFDRPDVGTSSEIRVDWRSYGLWKRRVTLRDINDQAARRFPWNDYGHRDPYSGPVLLVGPRMMGWTPPGGIDVP